jgi:Zn-finger protein
MISCSGNPKWIQGENKDKIKDCTDCLVPHYEEYVTKYFKEKKDVEDDRRKVFS